MSSHKLLLFITTMMFMQAVIGQSTSPKFTTVPKDMYHVKEYTLKNGLKVFIAINKQAPRVQTMIAVKAGSKYDPAQTTGLAHYLEHMMFKGTHHYGTTDWNKEKLVLDQVSALYEKHLLEKDEAKKRAIYEEIDKTSNKASAYAIPSEYDKMVSSIGASGTNAFTSNDMTVYVNDIPATAVDKWAKLESERFSTLVLRLFHTELETVYEEFNRSQDDDIRWSSFAVDSMLMPNHPYGTQTTIGLGQHLKNPSMVNIHRYFDTYYNPNNIAIILSGDVDTNAAIASIEKHFGGWLRKEIPAFVKKLPVKLEKAQATEIKGPTKEHLFIGFRFDGDGSRQAMLAKMMDMILSNGTTGLLDLNLIQKQQVLAASSYVQSNKDYSIFKLYGEPKQGQDLKEVQAMLLKQIEFIKRGEFEDWLIPAIVQNLRLQKMKSAESNRAVASEIMDAFVKDLPWKTRVNELDEMDKLSKKDIMNFAIENFKENYAVCYKRMGEPNRHKVEKPKITPVILNKDSTSSFKKAFDKIETDRIKPRFLDFNRDIKTENMRNGTVSRYIFNEVNKTFSLSLVYNIGTDNNKNLGVATEYMSLLGTDKLTVGQLKQEFYKIGVSYSIAAERDRITVNLTGLDENVAKGVELINDFIKNAKADKEVYRIFVGDVLKRRENAKINKNVILQQAMVNYAKYGKDNPFTNKLSEQELKAASAEGMIEQLKLQLAVPNEVRYYGQKNEDEVRVLFQYKDAPFPSSDPKKYEEQSLEKNQVLFCNYNMKQAEVIMIARDEVFNKELMPYMTLYNDYYGAGLSSILFQEIREKMGLAYAVRSTFGVPESSTESHYVNCYVGTQADKLETTMKQMQFLLSKMVIAEKQFDGARISAIKNMESERIKGEAIFAAYDRAIKRGLDADIRREMYGRLQEINIKQLAEFFNKHIASKPFTYLVMGKKENIDAKVLESLGEVKEVKLEDIFGY